MCHAPCDPVGNTLVEATKSVGSVNFWSFTVARTKRGGLGGRTARLSWALGCRAEGTLREMKGNVTLVTGDRPLPPPLPSALVASPRHPVSRMPFASGPLQPPGLFYRRGQRGQSRRPRTPGQPRDVFCQRLHR